MGHDYVPDKYGGYACRRCGVCPLEAVHVQDECDYIDTPIPRVAKRRYPWYHRLAAWIDRRIA